ncbi:MAG: hypothetical protein BYD32DRAFT_439521 [Podila humilis]|nr:MAG: hypothetical protein BYD32DRAFT_439521 [Podila humilis]
MSDKDSHTLRPSNEQLPGEVLDQIFSNMAREDILRSTRVCRHWHHHAIARLYFYLPTYPRYWMTHQPKKTEAMRKHRHLIRYLEWTRNFKYPDHIGSLVYALDLPSHILALDTDCLSEGTTQDNEKMTSLPLSPLATEHGPLQVASLRYEGPVCRTDFFPEFLLFFPHLRRLSLECDSMYGMPTALHLGLFLEALPSLEHLEVHKGRGYLAHKEYCSHLLPTSFALDEHNYAMRPKFRLRILEIEVHYLSWFRNQLLFSRLPYLQEFVLLDKELGWWPVAGSDYQPQTFSLWLNHCCPELKSIQCQTMTHPLDFQGLPAGTMLPGLNCDGTTVQDTWALYQALPQISAWMKFHYHNHTSSPARLNLFRHLERFASFNTRVQVRFPHYFLAQLRPTASRTTLTQLDLTNVVGKIHPACHRDHAHQREELTEMAHLQSRDLQWLLENCPGLVSFQARSQAIHAHDMMPDPEKDPHCHWPDYHKYEGARVVRPWACEDSLQELAIGIVCASTSMSMVQNQAAFTQLGRLLRLKRLDICYSSLVPRLDYGMDRLQGLVELQEFSWRYGLCPVPDKAVFQMLVRVSPSLRRVTLGLRKGSYFEEEIPKWLSGVEHHVTWQFMGVI